ncbi:MAG TPA: glycosyltransferase family 39 protein [Gemmatimonadales bacterium]|nr:glycosyltransferase family 39 protein [Gemmatimonadales bacterium]
MALRSWMQRATGILLGAAIGGLAAIALLWAVASLSWPFGFDQGAFAWVGDVILRGGVPYLDAFDVKGPMSFLPSAAVMAVAGRNWWGIRVFDLMLVSGMVITIVQLGRRYSSWTIAVAAALLWVLGYANAGYQFTAQPDGWMLWLLLFPLAPLSLGDVPLRRQYLMLAGVAAGLAAMLKPFYVIFLVIPLALVWRNEREDGHRWVPCVLVLMAALAPIALLVGWLALHHALPAFWEAYVRFNLVKNSQAMSGAASEALSYGLVRDAFVLLFLPLALAGVAALRTEHSRGALVWGLWLALALPLVLVQRPYYPYRLLILSPVLAILAAAAFGAISASVRQAPSSRAVSTVFGLALLSLGGIVLARYPLGEGLRWVKLASGRLSADDYYARYHQLSGTALDERLVSRRLAAISSPGDVVFAWNYPAVAVLANRRLLPRLSIDTPTEPTLPAVVREPYLDELRATRDRTPPDFVIAEDRLGREGACLSCLPPFSQLGASGEALAAPYQLVFRSGTLVMYRRD